MYVCWDKNLGKRDLSYLPDHIIRTGMVFGRCAQAYETQGGVGTRKRKGTSHTWSISRRRGFYNVTIQKLIK